MRREKLYLNDILLAAETIAGFLRGQTFQSFEDNTLLESAVAHQLTIIGEAAARLPEEFKARHPEVPWARIAGLRNQVVHHYFGLDWEDVWGTAIHEVPVLREQIVEILSIDLPG